MHRKDKEKSLFWKNVIPLISGALMLSRELLCGKKEFAKGDHELQAGMGIAFRKLQSMEETAALQAEQIQKLEERCTAVEAALGDLAAKVQIAIWLAAAALLTAFIAMIFAVFR